MHLWLLVLVAFTHFIDVASLPTYRERPLDESRGINHKSSLPTQVLPESVTAIIPPRAKDEADDELVDYSQKNLENLKISAGASLGNLLVQPGKQFIVMTVENRALVRSIICCLKGTI